ncbi:MAG TPA: helix-turn-helix transcriptional regulator [Terriglobales bacterium]|jgi:DNA-binding CsgD family transcriptional regulator
MVPTRVPSRVRKRPSFDDLLDVLYGSAVDTGMRAEFLRRCSAYFDCPTLAFIVNYRPERGVHAGVHGWSEQAQRLYQDHFALRDPWYGGYARAGVVPPKPGQVFIGRGSSVTSASEVRASEYWNDFARKHDPDHFYQGGIVTDKITLTMLRSPRQGDWDDRAVDEWRMLYPHFRRAFAIHEQVLDLREAMVAAHHAVDALDAGLIGLDAAGAVAFVNRTGEAILNRNDGLAVRGGRLIVSEPVAAGRLEQWLRAAIDPFGVGPGGDGMTIQGARGAVHLCLLPVAPEQVDIPARAKLVVLVSDRASAPKSREAVLLSLFALTPAEARVAMLLAGGRDPKEIADQGRTTPATVRFQLKAIYRKTGVRRQSELVRLISRLPGV